MKHNTISQRFDRLRVWFSANPAVPLILILSLVLNLWGNSWGTPDSWHPDELTSRAMAMVARRSLNPGYFCYGGMHYSTLAAGAVIPAKIYGQMFDPKPGAANTRAFDAWANRQKTRIIILARTISAFMATLLVFFTYLIGKLLFGSKVGVLAALFVSVSPYFVMVAHFATVDTSANFWYWLSCLLTIMIWKRGHHIWYALAFIAAGIAIGTKIDRLVILVPLLLSHFLRGQGLQIRKIMGFVPLIVVGYVSSNPTIVFSFFEFADGTTRETFFNMLRGTASPGSYAPLLDYIKLGLGFPLFLIAVGGLMYAAWSFVLGKTRFETGWLVGSILPFYLLFGFRFVKSWYAPFFFPALALFAAHGCFKTYSVLATRFSITRPMLVAAIGAIACSSLLYSISLVLQLSHDSRYLASEWIKTHIPLHASIEMPGKGPPISSENYRITRRLVEPAHYELEMRWRDMLANHNVYQSIRQAILSLERLKTQIFGIPARQQPYRAWYDHVSDKFDMTSRESPGTGKLAFENPDYVVLIGYKERARVSTLKSTNSGYQLLAEIRYTNPFGLKTRFSFVNPRVYIFQRREVSKSFATKSISSS